MDNPVSVQPSDRSRFDLQEPSAPETLEMDLPVTLEEINEGAEKTCTAAVRVPGAGSGGGGDGPSTVPRSFTVFVEPGAVSGTKYTFQRQGHQDPGRLPGTVVLVLRELPHKVFRRHGAHLVQEVTVSLREALTGCTLRVRTLDGRLLRVAITEIARPGYERRLPREGLPRRPPEGIPCPPPSRAPRGDLVLRLDVRFPVMLSRTCRALLDRALQQEEERQQQFERK